MNIGRLVAFLILCTSALWASAAGNAETFPTHPIKLIVPAGAGGSMDAMARVAAKEAGERLGQNIMVENRPGAGNTMAAIAMLAAEPNGYTLGLVSCATIKLPHVTKAQYDPLKDLTYISQISAFSLILATRADTPYKSVSDLVRESRTKPLFYGTAGKYNSPHLATLRLAEAAGGNWTNVPYKGDADAIVALLAGDLQFIATSNSVMPYIQSGKLRALGIFEEKAPQGPLESIPTMTQQGYAVVETCPFGIMGPKGMEPGVLKKLDAAFEYAVRSASVKSIADKFSFTPTYADTKAFGQWARQTFESDRELFRKLGKNPE